MEQQILTENTESLEVSSDSQPLVSISEPIQTELLSLDSQVEVTELHEESAVLLVLTEGGSLYKKAVGDGYSGTELEWLTELLDSKASVQFVVTTMADNNQAYASMLLDLEARVGDNFASNTRLSEVLAQRDVARTLEYQNLTAKIDSDIQATSTTLTDVFVTRDMALAQSISTLTAEFNDSVARITNNEQAISTEVEARTLAVQSLNSTFQDRITSEINLVNTTVSNANSSTATQIANLSTNFNNLLTSNISTVNTSISTETSARAAQIEVLRTDFTNGISAVLTEIQEVKIDTEGNTSAIDSITATVNNPTSGLTAAFTRANQAWTLANNTAGSFSIIEGKVNHPTTGLAATYAFAQQVEINAVNYTSSAINSLRNEITNPSATWIGSNSFIQSVKSTADGAMSATTTLNTRVTSLDNWKDSTATVQLTSHTNRLGQLESKAFIGVSSTSGGKATISGLTINSVDYSLRFQGNIFELTNTSGVQQLYFNTASQQWEFSGGLVAASFKTATSGYRVEMDGTSGFPLWFGTGSKTWSNGLFLVDSSGNVKIANADMFNCNIQGSLVTDSGTGIRSELYDDGTYLFWIGVGAKTDINGTFWVKKNGTGFIKGDFFQGQIIETKYASYSSTANEAATATISNHNSAGKTIEITGNGSVRARATGGNYSDVILEATGTIYRWGNFLSSVTVQAKGIFNADLNRTEWSLSYPLTAISSGHGSGIQTAQYQVTFSILNGSTPNFSYIQKTATVKTFENKLE
jgi:hypothetical protein